jgi:hypothetical protein
MTVHLRKPKMFIISVSKFKRYHSENHHFHILSNHILSLFVSILQSHPSLVPAPLCHPILCSRVDPSLGAETSRWSQETKEEELHDAQEAEAQAQEGQACCPQVLQGEILL